MTTSSVVQHVAKFQALKNVNALPRAALITHWPCVGFLEENLLAKRSPEYKQNGYGARPRDRRSTLVYK